MTMQNHNKTGCQSNADHPQTHYTYSHHATSRCQSNADHPQTHTLISRYSSATVLQSVKIWELQWSRLSQLTVSLWAHESSSTHSRFEWFLAASTSTARFISSSVAEGSAGAGRLLHCHSLLAAVTAPSWTYNVIIIITLSSANFMEGNILQKERTQTINNKIKLHILGVLMNKLDNWLMSIGSSNQT